MRRFNELVFEEIVKRGTTYTSATFNELLGQYDRLVVHAVVDHVDPADVAGSLTVYSEHSGDGVRWDAKNQIVAVSVTPGQTRSAAGTDPASPPSLAFVRLRLDLVTTGLARARVYVTARDIGG